MRWSLFSEIFRMSWDTVRGNKLRSFLTVLGIVIGITSIVGMTAMIRGFDESIKDIVRTLGPNTVYLSKMSAVSFSSGKKFQDLIMRPNITRDDAEAIQRSAPSIEFVDYTIGGGGPGGRQDRIFYHDQRTKPIMVIGTSEVWPFAQNLSVESGRFFTATEVQRHERVVVLGQGPANTLFPVSDPLDKVVRIGFEAYTVIGVMAKRPSPGGFNTGADDFVVIPVTTY